MSTLFEDTVIATNRDVFLRLDDPAPLPDFVLPDKSGNLSHGTEFSSVGPTHGIASPVETDPSSRAMFGRVGFWTPTPDRRNTFTWLVFGNAADSGSLSKVLLCRSGQVSISQSNLIWINGAGNVVNARLRIDGVTHNLSAPCVTGTWPFIALTYNAGVIQLRVNALLGDEVTGVTGDMEVLSDTDFFIGGQQSLIIDSFTSWGVDEVIIGSALSESEIREIYEASLASLPLSATINVRVVVELDTDQVDPVDFPFTHNFGDALSGSPRALVEHLSYKTNVLQSEPDYQQRINAQPHHVERTLEYFVTPTSSRARAMMQANLWTPGQTYKLPIAKDWGLLTAEGTTGADTLSLDTTLRDYEVGSYVVAWEDVYRPWSAQFFEITSRTDTELGITPDIGDTLPAGSTVMPARLAILPEDSLSIDSHLIDRETAALQFEILSTELSSRRVTAYTPAETYLTLEVFKLERAKVEWVDPTPYQISRRQQGVGTSTGNDFLRAIDTGSPQTIPIRVLLTSRASQAEFYGWTDARQGKANPVWVASEENDFTVVGRTSTTITVDNLGYATRYNLHSARRHIAILQTNGTYQYNRITAAVDNGDTETLTLASGPPVLVNISKVSFLRLCTAPDQFELRYHRDGNDFLAECEFVFTELLTTPE